MTTMPDAGIPPHNLEAERAVLGGCLLEHGEALARLGGLTAEAFYLEAHRQCFTAILACAARDEGIDPLTVAAELRAMDAFDQVGGAPLLAGLEAEAALLVHLADYARLIREAAAKRALIAQATALLRAAAAPGPVAAVLEQAQRGLVEISESVEGDGLRDAHPGAQSAGVITQAMVRSLELGAPEFVRPPVEALARLLAGGWIAGELVYLGAGPGTGKTALALEWATAIASTGQRVVIVSAEMTKAALARRLLVQRAEIPASALRSGTIDPEDWPRLDRAARDLAGLPIIVDDEALTLTAIRRLLQQHAPQLLIVDYIQLLQPPRALGEQRRLEVDALSRGLKRLSKRYGCVSLVLSQVNLVPNKKGWFQRPLPTALKESRGLLADADTVLLLWRPTKEDSMLELIVAKGRDHAMGTLDLHFTPTFLHFREV